MDSFLIFVGVCFAVCVAITEYNKSRLRKLEGTYKALLKARADAARMSREDFERRREFEANRTKFLSEL